MGIRRGGTRRVGGLAWLAGWLIALVWAWDCVCITVVPLPRMERPRPSQRQWQLE